MEHARCDDTEVKRVPSPDGKLVIVIYNRSCSGGTGLSTYADVQDPAVWTIWPRSRHSQVCFLTTLAAGYHQMDARWLDGKHIEVSSTAELDSNYGVPSGKELCNDIAVTYNFRIKPPPVQEAPDEETVAAIRTAIEQSGDCIRREFDPTQMDYLFGLVDDKQHRQAIELLCGNVWFEKCPISRETYAAFEQVATKMAIDPSCLENLKPLVQ